MKIKHSPIRLRFFFILLLSILCFHIKALEQSMVHGDNTGSLPVSKKQIDQYNEKKPKTIFELQQFRKTDEIKVEDIDGKPGRVTLVNLNPFINVWYLLTLVSEDGLINRTYHLENIHPDTLYLKLDPQYPAGIILQDTSKAYRYDLWRQLSRSEISEDRRIYTPLCDGKLWLRNKTRGHKSAKEWATDFLRDYIWKGDQVTNVIKDVFFKDSYLSTSREYTTGSPFPETSRNRLENSPALPLIDTMYQNHFFTSTDLGIPVVNQETERLKISRWYPVDGMPGIFINLFQPRYVSETVKNQLKKRVAPLDDVEQTAMVYMIAFDLDLYETGFAMGTDHPRPGWSERIRPEMRDDSLPGPDGIDNYSPLVNTGILNPKQVEQVAATFIGGFKRYHGVFRYSDLAWQNYGSHYGVVENGVVMSKLQPGLATIVIYADGRVDMKTWTEKDNAGLHNIHHARQNGVPIIEYDAVNNVSIPGRLVPRTSGNWSGSVDGRYRTIRAGLALQEYNGRRYLIYGCFSSATPSAMALVFQAFKCKYAFLLEMNALEHTYLAVYRHQNQTLMPYHLIKKMDAMDKVYKGKIIPRFVGYADNRDFFYLVKKK